MNNVVKQIMLHNCKVTYKFQCHFIEKILILYRKHEGRGNWEEVEV